MNFFVPLYLLAIYGAVRFFAKNNPAPKTMAEGDKSGSPLKLKVGGVNWSPLESVGIVLAIYFGAQIIGFALAYIVPLARGMNGEQAFAWLSENVYGQFVSIGLIEFISIYLLHLFLKRRRSNFATIGLSRKPRFSDGGMALLGFAAYIVIFLVNIAIAARLTHSIDLEQKQQVGFHNPATFQLPIVFMSLVIFPAVAEELMVRGFLYSGLKKFLPKYSTALIANFLRLTDGSFWYTVTKKHLPNILAVLITSGLFAMAHLQAGSGEPLLWSAAVDTFSLSLVLIYLKEKTGSLWAPIGLHMLKNSIAFYVLFLK